jgi:hypothetical protein
MLVEHVNTEHAPCHPGISAESLFLAMGGGGSRDNDLSVSRDQRCILCSHPGKFLVPYARRADIGATFNRVKDHPNRLFVKPASIPG